MQRSTKLCGPRLGPQNNTSKIRSMPYVFTEQGVAMLATILRTPIAVQTSLTIMDAFVTLRHFIIKNRDVYQSLNNINNRLICQENMINDNTNKINYIFSKFDIKEQLFLPGQVYDAYSDIFKLLTKSNDEIIVIDSYADKKY